MTKALFICGKARVRSPTAADIASQWDGIETDFAGLSLDADEKLSVEQIDWADIIFVMEPRHKKRLSQLFPKSLRSKRVVCLKIPDRFSFMQIELVELLRSALHRSLRR